MEGLGDWWASVLADDYYRVFPGAVAGLVITYGLGRLSDELARRDVPPRRFWSGLATVLALLAVPFALTFGVWGVYGVMEGHWVVSVVSLALIGVVIWALNNWENISRLFPRFGRFVSWLAR